jgi:hypothetical protein
VCVDCPPLLTSPTSAVYPGSSVWMMCVSFRSNRMTLTSPELLALGWEAGEWEGNHPVTKLGSASRERGQGADEQRTSWSGRRIRTCETENVLAYQLPTMFRINVYLTLWFRVWISFCPVISLCHCVFVNHHDKVKLWFPFQNRKMWCEFSCGMLRTRLQFHLGLNF